MTQIEKENAIERISGYVKSPRSATEAEYVAAKNELIENWKRDIACATMISFKDFQYKFPPTP